MNRVETDALERARLELFRARGFAGESRRWTDGEGRTTYAIARDGEGPRPTVLVHGGLAEAAVWLQMAPHLRGPVVIPDRPGHGLSDLVDYAGVDYRAAAAGWLLHVVDALGAEQVDLVGNSMGGYFAMAFALAHPARVRRLVLAGAPAGLDRKIPGFLRAWATPGLGRLVSAMVKGTTDPEKVRKRVMTGLCVHPERIPVEALRVAIALGQRPGYQAMARSMLRACLDLGGWRRELSMREPLAALAVPTLFAWGDRDSFAPVSSGQEVAARMPHARVEILTDAGHLPQVDQPEALAACIERFLSEPDSAAARVTATA